MIAYQDLPEALRCKIIEVVSVPDLTTIRPPIKLGLDEVPKLMLQITVLKKPWLAMKFNENIFIILCGLIFLCTSESEINAFQREERGER